jgi:hypothetical protein
MPEAPVPSWTQLATFPQFDISDPAFAFSGKIGMDADKVARFPTAVKYCDRGYRERWTNGEAQEVSFMVDVPWGQLARGSGRRAGIFCRDHHCRPGANALCPAAAPTTCPAWAAGRQPACPAGRDGSDTADAWRALPAEIKRRAVRRGPAAVVA